MHRTARDATACSPRPAGQGGTPSFGISSPAPGRPAAGPARERQGTGGSGGVGPSFSPDRQAVRPRDGEAGSGVNAVTTPAVTTGPGSASHDFLAYDPAVMADRHQGRP